MYCTVFPHLEYPRGGDISKIMIVFSFSHSGLFVPFCEKRWKRWKRRLPQKLCGKPRSSLVISQALEAKKAQGKVPDKGKEKYDEKHRAREGKTRSGGRIVMIFTIFPLFLLSPRRSHSFRSTMTYFYPLSYLIFLFFILSSQVTRSRWQTRSH